MEKKQFKAESQRLLDLMINSIYTHREIFLREIISNASDAIDKLAYTALTDEKVGVARDQFAITITRDKENRTLTVSDNGIGMSKEEMEENLGTIAKSGSLGFKQAMEKKEDIDIIGQFGVGFYSAFMVASEVTVISRKYGSDKAYKWVSNGTDGYTIEEAERENAGTDVIMVLKPDTEEDTYNQYLEEYEMQQLVRKYSDYIRYPIRMEVEKSRKKEDSPEDKPEYESYKEVVTLNSMVPIWQKNKKDVTEEEYNQFYQSKFYDYNKPLRVVHFSAEGQVSFKALLYIPSKAPYDFYTKDFKRGLQLYSSGVMIMENCEDLLPEHFRFVRGIVDSQDLSLNISREMLQHNRQLTIIARNIEKKIKSELKAMLDNDREKYEEFYAAFGRQLKYGAVSDYGAHKESCQDLLLFYSSTEKKPVTLAEYVSRMQPEQKFIYFASGDTVDAIDHMPQTELLKDHNMEILYFTDKADEFLPDMLQKYQDKPFRSAIDGDLELGDEQKPDETDSHQESFAFLKEALGDKVDQVKASTRLKTHPVCLSSGQGITFEMEKYFTAVQPELGMKAKRILEINVDHPAFAAFETARITDPDKAKKYAQILYNQACLIAGLPIENPSAYTDLICSLWK